VLKHVNDLLDMSRIEARKLKIELQDIDVAALVHVFASHFCSRPIDTSSTWSTPECGA
jgi:hypothetical protein